MHGDRRIFDQRSNALLGKTLPIVPGLTTGPATVRFSQDFPITEVTAQDLKNAELLTIAIDSFQTTPIGAAPVPTQVVLQGLLRFGTGGSTSFGQPQDAPPAAPGGSKANSAILWDVQFGSQITIPASSFQLSLRYVAYKNGVAFPAGSTPGPSYIVNVGFAYGSKMNNQAVTETEVITSIGALGSGSINKAPFARSLRINWAEYGGGAGNVSPMGVDFFSATGVSIWSMSQTNAAQPPPEFPWPPGAVAMVLQNNGAATMNNVEVIQYLSL